MHFSTFITGTTLVIASALLIAEAGGYNSRSSYPTDSYNGQTGASSAYNRNTSPYGPYHSYAVRPAIYGGHGLYHYKGYARYPAPPAAHYRHVRSHGSQSHYGLRPVKAVALAPAYSGSRHHKAAPAAAYRPTHATGSNRGHGAGYRAKSSGYNAAASSGYGSGTRSSYGSGSGYGQTHNNYNSARSHGYGAPTRSSYRHTGY